MASGSDRGATPRRQRGAPSSSRARPASSAAASAQLAAADPQRRRTSSPSTGARSRDLPAGVEAHQVDLAQVDLKPLLEGADVGRPPGPRRRPSARRPERADRRRRLWPAGCSTRRPPPASATSSCSRAPSSTAPGPTTRCPSPRTRRCGPTPASRFAAEKAEVERAVARVARRPPRRPRSPCCARPSRSSSRGQRLAGPGPVRSARRARHRRRAAGPVPRRRRPGRGGRRRPPSTGSTAPATSLPTAGSTARRSAPWPAARPGCGCPSASPSRVAGLRWRWRLAPTPPGCCRTPCTRGWSPTTACERDGWSADRLERGGVRRPPTGPGPGRRSAPAAARSWPSAWPADRRSARSPARWPWSAVAAAPADAAAARLRPPTGRGIRRGLATADRASAVSPGRRRRRRLGPPWSMPAPRRRRARRPEGHHERGDGADRRAVDPGDDVAGLQPGRVGRAAGAITARTERPATQAELVALRPRRGRCPRCRARRGAPGRCSMRCAATWWARSIGVAKPNVGRRRRWPPR